MVAAASAAHACSPSLVSCKNGICLGSFRGKRGFPILLPTTVKQLGRQRIQVFAQKGARSGSKDVAMVDPTEAKRLAAEQMRQREAKAKFKRRREIEAINGGWAMVGLTAGIVIEGYTGKSIMSQKFDMLSSLPTLEAPTKDIC